MTAPSLNYFYRVKITVARYVLGGIKNDRLNVRELETVTYNFVNKPLIDATTKSDRETYLPLLIDVGEVTIEAGDVLPSISVSSVVLDNSRGSFGYNRKFSDILERYTVTNQPIEFYIGVSDNEVDAPTSWTQIGSGTMTSWETSLSAGDPSLTLSITPFSISEKLMNMAVSRDIVGMENAPDASLNKNLPVLFCKTQPNAIDPLSFPEVVPVRISNDGATTGKYALCTHLYQTTKARFSGYVYAKKTSNEDDIPWTFIKVDRAPDDYRADNASSISLTTYNSFAYKILDITPTASETGFMVTGISVRAKANGTASRVSQGYLTAYILRVDKTTGNVVQEIANGRLDLRNYDALNNGGATYFNINFAFDKPVVFDLLSSNHDDYYFGFRPVGVDVNDLSLVKRDPLSTGSYARLIKSNSITSGTSIDDYAISPDTEIVAYKLITPTYTQTAHENTVNQDGFTYSSLTITQDAADTGQANPDFDNQSIVMPMEGFVDYTTSTQIYSPAEVFKILSYEFDGEQWSDVGAVDTTTLQTSHYDLMYEFPIGVGITGQYRRGRALSGISEGKANYSQLIAAVAEGTASKIGVLSNGKLFMYPWGVQATPAYTIPQADIIPLSWQVRDDKSIINRTLITAEKNYTVKSAFEDGEGYVISIDYNSTDYAPVQEMTEQSRSLFGSKDLSENTYDIFGFNNRSPQIGLPGYLTGGPSDSQVNDGTNVLYSVDFLADYYLSTYALSLTYCSFVVPYARYSNIRMFDIITFHHSDFPAFYGAEPNARPGVVNDGVSVTEVVNANFGEELVRAQRYRGIVESISYVMAMEHAPAIRLTVRVLLNRRFDPT